MKLPIGLRPSRCQEDFTPLPSQNNDDRTGYDRHCTEIVRLVTLSLPRRKMSKITRLKSGVVATTGETITTLALARATASVAGSARCLRSP